MRPAQAACRLGGARRVKVETVERVCRKVLGTDPRELYGEPVDGAWQHRGKRVNTRGQAFDHCFSYTTSKLFHRHGMLHESHERTNRRNRPVVATRAGRSDDLGHKS